MAELSVIPDLSLPLDLPPSRVGTRARKEIHQPPAQDTVEISPEATSTAPATLDDRQTRDAILLKIALEGKDFQTAREEVLKGKAPALAASEPTKEHSPDSPPPSDTQSVELTAVQVIHIQADVTTTEGSLHLDATRVEIISVSASQKVPAQKQDPLVVDFGGSGPETTGLSGARNFDLEGNGAASPTSFVKGETAFLALDRNGDGRIDSGKELFGDQHGAMDGYEELAKFDVDGNQRIDAADPVYSQLQLVFENGRQVELANSGIQSISLNATSSFRPLENGDNILRSGTARTMDGHTLATYAMGLQHFNATV